MNKEIVINQLKQYKKKFSQKYGIIELGLFGSVARGDAIEGSDIDIVVKLKRQNFLIIAGIENSLVEFLNHPVDVVTYGDHLSVLLKKRIKEDVIWL